MNSMILNCKYKPPIFIINNFYNEKKNLKNKSSSILSILEKHQIFIEYQCREGYCGLCRTKIINGEVFYINKPLALIKKNEILPCCCFSKGKVELYINKQY